MTSNFYRDPMGFFKHKWIPEQFDSVYQTTVINTPLSSTGTSNSFRNVDDYFWDQGGEVKQSRTFQLYLRVYASYSQPIVYYSSYSPRVTNALCYNSNFAHCRAYNTFHQRRYYLSARFNSQRYEWTFNTNLQFP